MPSDSTNEWYPTEATYQGYDNVTSTPGVKRVGRIGPHPDGQWSWVIQAAEDATGRQWIDEFGEAADENAAKAAVENWTPMPDEGGPFITKTGKVLTDSDIQALADDAESGYDVGHLRER